MPRNRIFFISICIFWLVIIGVFIAMKQSVINNGTSVLLKTVPVDPSDMFRGDYVTLKYEISTIDLDHVGMHTDTIEPGDSVFLSLYKGSDNYAEPVLISKQRPGGELFIKGTVKSAYGMIRNIDYGIESYFVPERQGSNIQWSRGNLDAVVSIDASGNAVVTGLNLDGKPVEFK